MEQCRGYAKTKYNFVNAYNLSITELLWVPRNTNRKKRCLPSYISFDWKNFFTETLMGYMQVFHVYFDWSNTDHADALTCFFIKMTKDHDSHQNIKSQLSCPIDNRNEDVCRHLCWSPGERNMPTCSHFGKDQVGRRWIQDAMWST